MLKEWLIRRRDNPYPSRDEKKALAYETGLTYTQICNWFANWRRKLKNSGKEPVRRSWGNLIKNYNTSAKGNVEQFSISSNDSIWGEEENNSNNYMNDEGDDDDDDDDEDEDDDNIDSNYSSDSYEREISNGHQRKHKSKNSYEINNNYLEQYNREPYYPPGYHFMNPNYQYQKETSNGLELNHKINLLTVNSTKTFEDSVADNQLSFSVQQHSQDQGQQQHQQTTQQSFSTNTKYKQQMMEKYLKDTNNYNNNGNNINNQSSSPTSSSTNISSSSPELSKWLESAAKFTPNKNNYIEWNSNQRGKGDKKLQKYNENGVESNIHIYSTIHQKEELEAAEALTNLACNYRMKMMNNIENHIINF
ncbi:homeobox protein 2 isoform X2 [Condylostylus longicornis]|nr:homeobox protein 2 isoform X2 [Condylostylus longicornis]XP_055390235.1 homeobox protein 2 isoform X2 [Condylostylus longicornis]